MKPLYRGEPKGQGRRVAVVASRFNSEIVEKLVAGAVQTLTQRGVAETDRAVVWVPGAWEIPVAVRRLAGSGDCSTKERTPMAPRRLALRVSSDHPQTHSV